MKVTVIKEKRKTIVLSLLDADNAVLKAPKNLSAQKIAEFLDEKKKWLQNKSEQIKRNEEFSRQFDLKNSFYLFGEKSGDFKELIFGFETLSDKVKEKTIKKFYLSHFSNLENLASKLSKETGFTYLAVKPTDSSRVWGSYNASKTMKLNWKLLLLPERLVKYVIYHELCHSKHMNHKPQFWNEVARFCPDYKRLRKELNTYGFLIKKES